VPGEQSARDHAPVEPQARGSSRARRRSRRGRPSPAWGGQSGGARRRPHAGAPGSRCPWRGASGEEREPAEQLDHEQVDERTSMTAERNGRSQALARVLARHTLTPQLCCSQPRIGFSARTAAPRPPSRPS
jgi:hypothetical protein